MIVAVVKIDGFFMEIKKEKDGIVFEKVEENVFDKVYTNVPCLIADTKGLFMKTMIFDATEEDSVIENTGVSLLNTKTFFTFIEKHQNKKIVFYMRKPEVVKLFKEFAFSKIVPLDIVLFRMAIKYQAEIVGIIGEKFFSYSRKVSFDNLETFFSNEGEYNTLLFEPKANISFFLEAVSKMLHIKKAIFTDKQIDEEELAEKNIVQVGFDDFKKFIEREKVFAVFDKYSDNYQSRIYKNILLGISGIMFVLSPYFFYKYIEKKTENDYYTRVYNQLQNKLQNIQAEENRYKIDYLYKVYKPFNFMNFYKTVSKIAKMPGVISYTYDKKFFPREGYATIIVSIKGIDNFLKFEKEFGRNIIKYNVYPNTKMIKAVLIIKNRKEHRRGELL